MPTTPGTGHRLPTTTTRTTATLSFPSSRAIQGEHITIGEVFDAYYDCRKRKRSKRSSVEYEMRYELNNEELWMELNAMTYKPTTSIAFCTTKPKLREVFAANFRDRVVHHLFIRKINDCVEGKLSDCQCACRRGRGTRYCAERVNRAMKAHPDGWYVKFDVQGFFMSIDKDILLRLTEQVVRACAKEDTDWWLWLARTIIMHRPEQDCVMRGDSRLWDALPDNKTLFRSDGTGLPIGNLPSQVLANLYMADFCRFIVERLGGDNGSLTMYADDGIMVGDNKRLLLKTLNEARQWLWKERRMKLHPSKITIQRVRRGCTFTGIFHKADRMRPGRRTIRNAMSVAERWKAMDPPVNDEDKQRMVCRYNSYLGLMRHYDSYNTRRRMWRRLGHYDGINNYNMTKIKITKQ